MAASLLLKIKSDKLVNEDFANFTCTHPWFTAEVHGLTRSENNRFKPDGDDEYEAVWYWWSIERRVAMSVEDGAITHRKPADGENYLFRGCRNGIPTTWLHAIPLLTDGLPYLAKRSGGRKINP